MQPGSSLQDLRPGRGNWVYPEGGAFFSSWNRGILWPRDPTSPRPHLLGSPRTLFIATALLDLGCVCLGMAFPRAERAPGDHESLNPSMSGLPGASCARPH